MPRHIWRTLWITNCCSAIMCAVATGKCFFLNVLQFQVMLCFLTRRQWKTEAWHESDTTYHSNWTTTTSFLSILFWPRPVKFPQQILWGGRVSSNLLKLKFRRQSSQDFIGYKDCVFLFPFEWISPHTSVDRSRETMAFLLAIHTIAWNLDEDKDTCDKLTPLFFLVSSLSSIIQWLILTNC